MQLKTVSSIGLAFLLVFGVVGVASAQVEVAATQGILIRVDAPAADKWVAIGDTIRVRILCYEGRLGNGTAAGFQLAVVDSSVADADIGSTVNLDGGIFYNFDNTDNRVTFGDGGPSPGSGSGVDTFNVKIGVVAGAGIESASNHALKVVVDPVAAGEASLNNLMRNKKITPATAGFGASRVGDGKLFGVDGARPVHANVFTSIALDLGRLNTVKDDTMGSADGNPPYVQQIQIVTDKVFRAVLNLNTASILQARADRIEVGLVPTDSITAYQATGRAFEGNLEGARAAAFKDDARLKVTLRGDRLYSPNPSVEQKVAAGQFKDNERLELFAYLVDVAGNVGGTVTTPAAADWKSLHGTDGVLVQNPATPRTGATPTDPTVLPIIGDATAPKVTVNYPNPDSIADGSHDPLITAAITQTLGLYDLLPGEPTGVQNDRRLKPLEFKLSETPSKITIKHADSTLTLDDYVIDDPDAAGTNLDIDATGGDNVVTVDFLNIQDNRGVVNGTDSVLVAPSNQTEWFTQAAATGVVAGIAKGKYEAKGGTAGDIIITVWDSLGNKTEYKSLTGITLDGNTPGLSNLFPTADTAPKDAENEDAPTIGPVTKNPVFQINEELDSLSIRYHEQGGGPAIVQAYSSGNNRLETVGSLQDWPVNDTTFIDRQRYNLEILAIDLAGNASVTEGGTLTFQDVFTNPSADLFKVVPDAALKEKQVAGVDYAIALSVVDTTLTKKEKEQDSAAGDVLAVTYHNVSAIAAIVSGDQAAALEGASFSGTGVTPAPVFALPAELAAAGMVAKAFILDADGWHAGQRTVKFKSEKPLTGVTLYAAEGTPDPATGAYVLHISGQAAKPIDIQIAEFSKLRVTAIEGEISTDNVAGSFTVTVIPTDAFDNPSLRIDNNTGSKDYTSVSFTFSSSNAAVSVPSGQQMVTSLEGSTYGAVAGTGMGGAATISVRTVKDDFVTGALQADTPVKDKTGALTGAVTVNIVSDDGPGPDPGAPAAVANVVVQDYKGADGEGDQGGVVVVSFPNSSQHEAVSAYQISPGNRLDHGSLMMKATWLSSKRPVKKWVAWTSVSFDAGRR